MYLKKIMFLDLSIAKYMYNTVYIQVYTWLLFYKIAIYLVYNSDINGEKCILYAYLGCVPCCFFCIFLEAANCVCSTCIYYILLLYIYINLLYYRYLCKKVWMVMAWIQDVYILLPGIHIHTLLCLLYIFFYIDDIQC